MDGEKLFKKGMSTARLSSVYSNGENRNEDLSTIEAKYTRYAEWRFTHREPEPVVLNIVRNNDINDTKCLSNYLRANT